MWDWISNNSDVINVFIQLFVLVAIAIYAWDTRRIKKLYLKQSLILEKQLMLLEKQLKISVSPYLLITVQQSTSEEKKTNPEHVWNVCLDNPTSKMVFSVWAYIYDGKHKNFLTGQSGKVHIAAGATDRQIEIFEKYLKVEDVEVELERYYGNDAAYASPCIRALDDFCIVVFCRDAEGRLHTLTREFEFKNNEISYFGFKAISD